MKLVVLGRRAGKTHFLIQQLKAVPTSRLVVPWDQERDRLVVEYELKPDVASRIISMHDAPMSLQGRDPMDPVYVDNLDTMIRHWLGAHGEIVGTMTDLKQIVVRPPRL